MSSGPRLDVVTPAAPVCVAAGAACSCAGPGYCPRRGGRAMPASLWRRCQDDQGFRRVLDVKYGVGTHVHGRPLPPAGASPSLPGAPTAAECGVVIGHYGMPALAELQIRLLREHCGPEPRILLADDQTGPGLREQLYALPGRYPGVAAAVNAQRLGHVGGDLAAYHRAITWGKARGLRYVAKLSQRFLIDRPDWLLTIARQLHASGLPAAGRQWIHHDDRGRLHTEALVLDVAAWDRPDVLAFLEPRRVGPDCWAEYIVWHPLYHLLGGKLLLWDVLGEVHKAATPMARTERRPGVLWHHSHTAEEYRAVAGRYGIDLGEAFTCAEWDTIEGGNHVH